VDDQFGQVKLAFDVIFDVVGLSNFCKDCYYFSPFQLVYGLEAVLPIECQIPSLKLAVELLPDTTPLEEHLLYLEQLDEQRRDAALANEAHKK
jgi:hypothetical protein